jgi:hypothetical protein
MHGTRFHGKYTEIDMAPEYMIGELEDWVEAVSHLQLDEATVDAVWARDVIKHLQSRIAGLEPAAKIGHAVSHFTREMPGWWWSLGDCSVSADASCGPDVAGPDAHLLCLEDRTFDEGFHADLPQPASVVDALKNVMEQAKAAKAAL